MIKFVIGVAVGAIVYTIYFSTGRKKEDYSTLNMRRIVVENAEMFVEIFKLKKRIVELETQVQMYRREYDKMLKLREEEVWED